MNRTINTILAILPVFFSFFAVAQNKTTVKAAIDRSSILIGEPIRLTLQADIPENQPIRFFRLDSLAHFEFLKTEKIDTSNTPSGTVLTQVIHITSFDSGHWVIPSLLLHDKIATDSLPVDVGYSPFDPQQPYHDIKDIIGVTVSEKPQKETWWYYVAGSILLLLILWLLLRKKKKPVPPTLALPVDPYKVAMERLALLQKDKRDSKYYYSALTDIFRLYVSEKKGIHSLQKTVDDLVVQLRDLGLPKEQFDRLWQALRLGDFVKFAKYVPSPEDDRNSFDVIKQSIGYIQELPGGSAVGNVE